MIQHNSEEMRRCIENCVECYKICMEATMYSAQKGGDYVKPKHLRLLMECANICNTSANFMLLGSEHHEKTCEVCAEVCRQCAEECNEIDDAMLKNCAEICLRCAESCQEMATMHA
jgi:hypothetical protein